jgi:putative NADH-flavin reductase
MSGSGKGGKMKVLVMTANGMFGNRVVKSLSERGVQVRAMVRDGGQLGTSIGLLVYKQFHV